MAVTKRLQTFPYKSFRKHVSFLLGKYLGMELLGHRVSVYKYFFNFLTKSLLSWSHPQIAWLPISCMSRIETAISYFRMDKRGACLCPVAVNARKGNGFPPRWSHPYQGSEILPRRFFQSGPGDFPL